MSDKLIEKFIKRFIETWAERQNEASYSRSDEKKGIRNNRYEELYFIYHLFKLSRWRAMACLNIT